MPEKKGLKLANIDAMLAESIEDNKRLDEATIPDKNDVENALIPQFNLNIPGMSNIENEQHFDIKVNRVAVRKFYMGLVDGTDKNIVLHPKVSGKVTLDLKNVTVAEVMEIVRDVFGYDFDVSDNTYKVYPNIIRTRIFKINYLDVQRKGDSQMRVSSGQITQSSSNRSGSNSSNNNYNNNNYNNNSGSQQRQVIAGSRVSTKFKSEFWKELSQSLTAMLSSTENSSIIVNAQSGVIVARAYSSELRDIDAYLKKIQSSIQRQVILEAKILEVELNDSFQAGVNWAALQESANNSFLAGQTGGGSIFENGTSIIDGNTGNLNPAALSQVNSTATSAFGGVFTIALNIGSDFAAFIELLETQGEVQVLSSPQISTINNQKAVIKVGTDEFFITDISSNTNTSSATSNTQNDVEFTPFFSGVALDVIPQISDEQDIILHIHPSVSKVDDKIKQIAFADNSVLTIPLAISTIRESDNIIRAHNGQVVVIGGLMQDATVDEEASVPILGDIPLIGGLFRHTRRVRKKSELIILLKPIIVESSQQWTNKIERSRYNFKNLRTR